MEQIEDFLGRFPSIDDVSDPVVIVPTFNNGRYLENCLRQLRKLNLNRFVVFDGGSTEIQTLRLLADLSREGRVLTFLHNPGPRHFFLDKRIFRALPEIFCVTDPDLDFNPGLPAKFLNTLFTLTEEFQIGKAGFALSLEGDITSKEFFFGQRWRTIPEWEGQFWSKPRENSLNLEIYEAPIDTTFALYNKKYLSSQDFFRAMRVAGNFTAKHLPWHVSSSHSLGSIETVGPHSTWNLENSLLRQKKALGEALRKISEMEASFSWRITSPLRRVHKLTSATMRSLRKFTGKTLVVRKLRGTKQY